MDQGTLIDNILANIFSKKDIFYQFLNFIYMSMDVENKIIVVIKVLLNVTKSFHTCIQFI